MTDNVTDITPTRERRRRTRESIVDSTSKSAVTAPKTPPKTRGKGSTAKSTAKSTNKPKAASKSAGLPPGRPPASLGGIEIAGPAANLPSSGRQKSAYDDLLAVLITKSAKLKADEWLPLDLKGRRPNTVQSGLQGAAKYRGKVKVTTRVRMVEGVQTLFVRAFESL